MNEVQLLGIISKEIRENGAKFEMSHDKAESPPWLAQLTYPDGRSVTVKQWGIIRVMEALVQAAIQ